MNKDIIYKELMDYFILDSEASAVLLGLERCSIIHDIKSLNQSTEIVQIKKYWLQSWEKSIKTPFFSNKKLIDIFESDYNNLQEHLRKYKKEIQGLILFEASIFKPYYDMNKRGLKLVQLKKEYDKFKKENSPNLFTEINFEKLEITKKQVQDSILYYNDALKNTPSNNIYLKVSIVIAASIALAVTGGLAAPAIGTAIGGLMGLSGAVATSAGLAFLGGGALAAGGFGMAGGTALIIGGGALFGATLGYAIGDTLLENDKFVLSQLARQESIIKAFLNCNTEIIDQVNSLHRGNITKLEMKKSNLEKELPILKNNIKALKRNNNDDVIRKKLEKNLKSEKARLDSIIKSIDYSKNTIKRLEDLKPKYP